MSATPRRLLLHDTLATAPLVYPFTAGWVTPTFAVETRVHLAAINVGATDAALIPAAEITLLQTTHQVVPDFAAVAGSLGTIALRVPVRPDEIERAPVRLLETSGTAEILARATLQPFYGIEPVSWHREATAAAQVVIVEGAEALREPEVGYAEDLCRAWLILTGEPVVSHLLVIPTSWDEAVASPVLSALRESSAVGHKRRRELRIAVADHTGISRERVTTLFADMRWSLTDDDRRALLRLLQRGNRGSAYPYPWRIPYAGFVAATEADGL